MTEALRVGFIVLLVLAAGTTMAFNGHMVTEGPLELTIGPIADVEKLGHHLPGGERAAEPHLARGAERAFERTACLRGEA